MFGVARQCSRCCKSRSHPAQRLAISKQLLTRRTQAPNSNTVAAKRKRQRQNRRPRGGRRDSARRERRRAARLSRSRRTQPWHGRSLRQPQASCLFSSRQLGSDPVCLSSDGLHQRRCRRRYRATRRGRAALGGGGSQELYSAASRPKVKSRRDTPRDKPHSEWKGQIIYSDAAC